METEFNPIKSLKWFFIIIVLITIIYMAVMPVYRVWAKELHGKAELKQAEYTRQIAIVEAEAKKQSAQYLADAEVIRAQGIAQANKIIGDSITPNYLKYKFIEGLNDGTTETIYVPTEANIPILEVKP